MPTQRAADLVVGHAKMEESKRTLFSVSLAGSPTKPLANASRWAADDIFEQEIEMTRNMSVVLYIVVMIAVVVSVDLLFFKNRFWERLTVNIGIVLVFAASTGDFSVAIDDT